MTTGRRAFLAGFIPAGAGALAQSRVSRHIEPLGHCGVDPAHECKEQSITGAIMTSASYAPSSANTGAVVWDLELHNTDPANYSRGQAPSGGPAQGLIRIESAGTYLITASVLLVADAGAEVEVDLYVDGAGYPTTRVDSWRGTAGPAGYGSAKLGGAYVLPNGGTVIVQSNAWMHGDSDPRWTNLSVVKLSD